jgi:hypothetical protein
LPVFNTIKSRDEFCERKDSNQNLVFMGFKNLNNGGASDFQVVTFNQGAGVKEVKHKLFLFPHARNLTGEIPLDFTQASVDFPQGGGILDDPFLRDIRLARAYRQSSANEILNSNFVYGLHDFTPLEKADGGLMLSSAQTVRELCSL